MRENGVVVQQIEKVLSQEFCCYGYKNMTAELREMGWIINHKKVYRLMKESRLLYGARIRPVPFKRDFIRFRSLKPERPLQYLSMDIKYVYIQETDRNALLLTVIDIYSRKVLIYLLRSHIKKGDVLLMLSLMLLEYKAEGMSIRNDNGSQFIAQVVRQYLKDKGIYQEFSHVATPEDTAVLLDQCIQVTENIVDVVGGGRLGGCGGGQVSVAAEETGPGDPVAQILCDDLTIHRGEGIVVVGLCDLFFCGGDIVDPGGQASRIAAGGICHGGAAGEFTYFSDSSDGIILSEAVFFYIFVSP